MIAANPLTDAEIAIVNSVSLSSLRCMPWLPYLHKVCFESHLEARKRPPGGLYSSPNKNALLWMCSFKSGPGKQIVWILVPAPSFSVRESYFNSNVYFSPMQNEITVCLSLGVIVIIELINVCKYLKAVLDTWQILCGPQLPLITVRQGRTKGWVVWIRSLLWVCDLESVLKKV